MIQFQIIYTAATQNIIRIANIVRNCSHGAARCRL